jgi:N-acetylmuramoyl-L-alanine amidase
MSGCPVMNRLLAALAILLTGVVQAEPRTFTTVVIDAGHGGHDRGGIPGVKVAEKKVALETALLVEEALKAAGFQTIMTRRTDVFVTLDGRVALANANPKALFLSIHYNAGAREGAEGIETFYGGPKSEAIAARIHRSLISGTGVFDRGVEKAKFYVLRKSRAPAVLVECGFLTNPGDAKRAESADYQQKVADAIVAALK